MVPNFMIIGGVRCGTTSMLQQLREHPAVYMSPIKEPDYFIHEGMEALPDSEWITTFEEYQECFEDAEPNQVTGEASATYLYLAEVAAPRIRRQLSDVRLIVQLRHPVERAFSQFRMARMVGREPVENFADALRMEDDRVAEGAHVVFHYRRQSLYHDRLKRFLDLFGPDRVQVTLFRDYVVDPATVLSGTFEFLDVDSSYELRNPGRAGFSTRKPRAPKLDRWLNCPGPTGKAVRRLIPAGAKQRLRSVIERSNRPVAPPLDPEVRARLVDFYREDVLRLQDLLDRDLTVWLH